MDQSKDRREEEDIPIRDENNPGHNLSNYYYIFNLISYKSVFFVN